MKQPLKSLLATIITLLCLMAETQGQENLPFGPSNYEQDLQIFAPFDLDLDNMSDDQWSGYFFEYNKLFWSYSGESVTVGSGNVSESIVFFDGVTTQVLTTDEGVFAEQIYRVNPQDFVNPNNPLPAPYVVRNTLNDVPPKAGFAFGNRYEFGYQDQGHGWQLGVLDGPELNQTEFYGFERVDTNGDGILDGLPPFIDPDYTDNTDIANDGGPFGQSNGPSADPGSRAFGFGSVPINFEAPPGFFQGFRDYMNNFSDALLGTQRGPIAYVGTYGEVQDPEDLPIPFLHLADDINGNGILGAFPIIVIGPDGVARLSFIHDFDDLHKFNVFFDSVRIHSRTETDGIEAMWVHDLTNNHYMAKLQNNRLRLQWGARFLKLYDEFRVDAFGSILHDAFWDTSFTNQIVGPQVGLQWVNQRQRWRLQTDARFMFGYNIADWDQIGLMGFGMIPGALNQPLYGRPTAFSHGLSEQDFSPVGELRVQASYHLTSAFALKFGYTGSFVGNIKRAAPSVHYNLPDMGYVDAGGQDLLINGFDFGVEFVH
jgi:hypothetical protein